MATLPTRSTLRFGASLVAVLCAAALASATASAILGDVGTTSTSQRGDASSAGSAIVGTDDAADASPAVALEGGAGDLAFSTFLGGLEWDEATGVATDAAGNTVVAGFTLSLDFPLFGGLGRGGAIVDGFVTKLAPDRSRILWSTKLGGNDMDTIQAVAVDADDNVYVAGRTGSRDFPTVRALNGSPRGRACTGEPCHDAFIAKLSSNGRLIWSTYFGGRLNEEAVGLAVDRAGDVYIAGLTDSFDLPVRGAVQRSFQSPPCPGDSGDLPCFYDAFVSKFSSDGQRLLYSTYLGGDATDLARGIAVDRLGNAYVVGSSSSANFPTVRAFDGSLHGEACGPPPGEPCPQAFLAKLGPNGGTLLYSTFLGGRDTEHAYSVALDSAGRPHVTGSTSSPDYPVRAALQPRLDNAACTETQPEELCDDGFVTKFNANGRSLVYSTYLGGSAEDQGLGVTVDADGNAVVVGRTDSVDFPTESAAQPNHGGYIDGFATKLRPAGDLVWSTFLGGEDADRATGVIVDSDAQSHVVGRTLSPDFPTHDPVQAALRDDDYDAFASIFK